MNSFLAQLDARRVLWKRSSKPDEVWICHGAGCLENGERTPDTRFRLGVNLRNGKSSCFNCKWKSRGDWTFKALSKLFRISYESLHGFQVDEPEAEHEEKRFVLPHEFVLFEDGSDLDAEFGQEAFRYLTEERKVPVEQIRKKRIGYAVSGRYSYRILFPVWDEQAKLVGLVGRSWCNAEPKYLNASSESGFERTFYNAHRLKKARLYPIVIAEGVFDALAIERTDYVALASLGSVLTESQIELLDGVRQITLFVDFDETGVRDAIKNAEALNTVKRYVKIAYSRKRKDAGDMTDDEIRECLSQARYAGPYERLQMTVELERGRLF